MSFSNDELDSAHLIMAAKKVEKRNGRVQFNRLGLSECLIALQGI